MKRKPLDPDSDSFDIASLRASLMGEKGRDGKRATPPEPAVPPPTAEDVLRSSPNVVRLCESYDQNRSRTRQRGRTQLLGVAGMVSAILVAVVILFRQEKLGSDPVVVYQMAAAAAGASIAAVIMLLVLRHRDQRRLRDLQGDRLIRAVRLKCALAPDRVEAYVGQGQPAQSFFECYARWREMSNSKSGARTTTSA